MGEQQRAAAPRLVPQTDVWYVGLDDTDVGDPRQEELLRERVFALAQEHHHDLPLAAVLAEEIGALLRKSSASATSVASVVERDPFLAGSVLRLANSAFYGFARPAETLSQAITRIGFDALQNLLYALAVKSQFDGVRRFKPHVVALWRHSLAASIAAGRLAELGGNAEERPRAALAGLLHDAGVAVLLKAADELVDRLARDSRSPIAWFNGVVWPLHAEAGAVLGRDWNLDEELVDALRFHHGGNPAVGGELTRTVALADALAGAALLPRERRRRSSRSLRGLFDKVTARGRLAARHRESFLGLEAVAVRRSGVFGS